MRLGALGPDPHRAQRTRPNSNVWGRSTMPPPVSGAWTMIAQRPSRTSKISLAGAVAGDRRHHRVPARSQVVIEFQPDNRRLAGTEVAGRRRMHGGVGAERDVPQIVTQRDREYRVLNKHVETSLESHATRLTLGHGHDRFAIHGFEPPALKPRDNRRRRRRGGFPRSGVTPRPVEVEVVVASRHRRRIAYLDDVAALNQHRTVAEPLDRPHVMGH